MPTTVKPKVKKLDHIKLDADLEKMIITYASNVAKQDFSTCFQLISGASCPNLELISDLTFEFPFADFFLYCLKALKDQGITFANPTNQPYLPQWWDPLVADLHHLEYTHPVNDATKKKRPTCESFEYQVLDIYRDWFKEITPPKMLVLNNIQPTIYEKFREYFYNRGWGIPDDSVAIFYSEAMTPYLGIKDKYTLTDLLLDKLLIYLGLSGFKESENALPKYCNHQITYENNTDKGDFFFTDEEWENDGLPLEWFEASTNFALASPNNYFMQGKTYQIYLKKRANDLKEIYIASNKNEEELNFYMDYMSFGFTITQLTDNIQRLEWTPCTDTFYIIFKLQKQKFELSCYPKYSKYLYKINNLEPSMFLPKQHEEGTTFDIELKIPNTKELKEFWWGDTKLYNFTIHNKDNEYNYYKLETLTFLRTTIIGLRLEDTFVTPPTTYTANFTKLNALKVETLIAMRLIEPSTANLLFNDTYINPEIENYLIEMDFAYTRLLNELQLFIPEIFKKQVIIERIGETNNYKFKKFFSNSDNSYDFVKNVPNIYFKEFGKLRTIDNKTFDYHLENYTNRLFQGKERFLEDTTLTINTEKLQQEYIVEVVIGLETGREFFNENGTYIKHNPFICPLLPRDIQVLIPLYLKSEIEKNWDLNLSIADKNTFLQAVSNYRNNYIYKQQNKVKTSFKRSDI